MKIPAPQISIARLLPVLLAAASLPALAQAPPETQPIIPPEEHPVISPEVHPDRTVTFRLRIPHAQKVSVSVEGQQDLPMTRDAQGVWSGTTTALEPDLYGYNFTVDGTDLVDPANPRYKENLLYPSGIFEVAAEKPQPWDQAAIPHGEQHRHFYASAVAGDQRDYFVYTPPGFDARARTKYPILYLLHGFSDTAAGWSSVGRAHFILDTLIAEGKARPMIVVMPLGYGVPDYASHHSRNFADPDLTQRNLDRFRDALLTEVMPQVEREYPVLPGRENHAITGLSMGGGESLYTALNHLDKFAWIGAFSMAGITNGAAGHDYAKIFPALTAKDASRIRLLWIACGVEDRFLDGNHELIAWLRTKGIAPTAVETPGGHAWMVWRRNLIAFASQLFQK